MGERKTEVRTYSVDYVCDDCGKGVMKPTGEVSNFKNPPEYVHKCTECGVVQSFVGGTYPKIVYGPIDSNNETLGKSSSLNDLRRQIKLIKEED